MRVAVVGGGASPEHDVSLRGAAAVAVALRERGHDVVPVTVLRDGRWSDDGGALGDAPAASLAAALGVLARCDVVFPVLHGRLGEDGTVAGLLELAGVPYVGCGPIAGAIAMDKAATKAIAASIGIAVADGVVVHEAPPDVSLPAVVKPTTAGSSVGVTVVRTASELAPAIAAARAVGGPVLVERYVRGTEVQVGVVERADGSLTVTPAIEYRVPDGDVFDTSRKYDGTAVARLPAAVPEAVSRGIADAARALFLAIGCRGLARFDFFVTADGVLLNEVNTMPGMTAQSGFPKMCAAAGIDHAALCDALVRAAV